MNKPGVLKLVLFFSSCGGGKGRFFILELLKHSSCSTPKSSSRFVSLALYSVIWCFYTGIISKKL